MKKLSHATLAVLLTTIVFLPQASCGPAQVLHLDLTLKELTFDGQKRTYYLHLPSKFESTAKLPVVLVLHGGGKADGDEVAQLTGYNKIADRESFIAVYPNGVNAQWNDGRGKTFRRAKDNINVDDVGFISALIDLIIRDYKGDPSRIYVTGLSNGGMMTLRLGCEIGSKLAAIAPVIANIPKNIIENCSPESPLPVLLMNGTDDPFVPWDGGPVTILGKPYGAVVSTEETVEFWVKYNKCSSTPTIETLPDNNTKDRSRVKVSTYANKDNGCDVILYTIEGGGHTFPGSNTPDRPHLLGRKNNDINGPQIIWEFFKHHAK